MSRLICSKHMLPISYLATAMEQGSGADIAWGEQSGSARLPLCTALLRLNRGSISFSLIRMPIASLPRTNTLDTHTHAHKHVQSCTHMRPDIIHW